MRGNHQRRRGGRAWIAGCAAVAWAATSVVPAQAAWAASQDTARPAVAKAPHLCTAWTHDGHKRTQLADKLDTDIEAAVHGRGDTYGVRVKDPDLGIECGLNSTEHFKSASAIKATILAALLLKAHEQHRSLTAHEKSLAYSMITVSDNNAATALWNDVGRAGLQKFLDLGKMKATVLGPGGYWGDSLLTAKDETTLLWLLLRPNAVLTTAARDYELSLIAHGVSYERWGGPAGAPAGFQGSREERLGPAGCAVLEREQHRLLHPRQEGIQHRGAHRRQPVHGVRDHHHRERGHQGPPRPQLLADGGRPPVHPQRLLGHPRREHP